jgi:hypothetical protein
MRLQYYLLELLLIEVYLHILKRSSNALQVPREWLLLPCVQQHYYQILKQSSNAFAILFASTSAHLRFIFTSSNDPQMHLKCPGMVFTAMSATR